MEIPIIYEDADIIIVNKPSGLNSQPSHDKRLPDVYSLLTKKFIGKGQVYLHHRIDKETSGILLLGKSKQANKPLTDMFREHQFERTYLAITKPLSTVAAAKSEKNWTVENYLRTYKDGKIMKQQVRKSGGDFSKTEFQMLDSNSKSCLILAKPFTGRMHQIRIHLATNQLPIWGDKIYGGRPTVELQNSIPRLMLHAWKMNFKHPITQTPMEITAQLPADFKNAVQILDLKSDFFS